MNTEIQKIPQKVNVTELDIDGSLDTLVILMNDNMKQLGDAVNALVDKVNELVDTVNAL